MPALDGLLTVFPEIPLLSVDRFNRFLPQGISRDSFYNYFANRLLFPQTVSETQQDILFDEIIFKAALLDHAGQYYSAHQKQIYLTEALLKIFPNGPELVSQISEVITGGIEIPEVLTVVLKGQTPQLVGSLIRPKLDQLKGELLVTLSGKQFKLPIGHFSSIPVGQSKVQVTFGNQTLDVCGGSVGVCFDLRGGPVVSK